MTKERQPSILSGVKLGPRDVARLPAIMQNWMRVHAHMTKQKRDWHGYHELAKMLKYELMHSRRMDVVLRLFRRMTLISREIQERELLAMPLK